MKVVPVRMWRRLRKIAEKAGDGNVSEGVRRALEKLGKEEKK